MSYFSKIKIQIVNNFPFTSRWSRYIKAAYNAAAAEKKSYSQHGEDAFIVDLLTEALPNTTYNYIDIGAFHPVLLSNTYLLYRRKMNGVIVEPNRELLNLHKTFRPRDKQLEIACSNLNSLGEFHFQKTFPALSSLKKVNTKTKVKSQFVPILNLDTIYQSLDFSKVHFLSIDVEGFDLEVLQGAEKTLPHTFLICIECESPSMEDAIKLYLKERDFIFLKQFACNLIFKNEKFSS